MGMQGRHHVLTVFCLNLRRGAYGRPVLINVFFFFFVFVFRVHRGYDMVRYVLGLLSIDLQIYDG